MITEAFLHCPGIGPTKLQRFLDRGLQNWGAILEFPERLPFNARLSAAIVDEIQQCNQALFERDIHFLTQRLAAQDQWRILGHFFEKTSFFDIETTGLNPSDSIAVIVCYHKGKLHHFVDDGNIEAFLDLLDDVELLASFNGASFDVPRVLDFFHIPELPCPHIDVRWICYHSNYSGGLKSIAEQMAIELPADVRGVDGADAIILWDQWIRYGKENARRLLLRYCASDVIQTILVADQVLTDRGVQTKVIDS